MPGSTLKAMPGRSASVAGDDVGLFVHVETDAVAGAVDELSPSPASVITDRAAASTCSAVTPGPTAATARPAAP